MVFPIGLVVLQGFSKTVLELALEYYVGKLIKNGDKYFVHHIDEICQKEEPKLDDTYVARVKGYCTAEEALKKIEKADSALAKNIKQLIYLIHEEDDFIIIEDDAVQEIILIDSSQDEVPTTSACAIM